MFEHASGRAPEQVEEMPVVSDPDDIANLSWSQMRVIAASLTAMADPPIIAGNGTTVETP